MRRSPVHSGNPDSYQRPSLAGGAKEAEMTRNEFPPLGLNFPEIAFFRLFHLKSYRSNSRLGLRVVVVIRNRRGRLSIYAVTEFEFERE